MANPYFQFKQFTIRQDRCAMKVTTDACLFGAWVEGEASRQSFSSQSFGLQSGSQRSLRRMLDIGTGTGLLSLMMAQQSDVAIDAIEIDKDAFEQGEENVMHSPWKERIHVIHADARHFHPPVKYDVIVSNPPFYENELKSASDKKNIARHSSELSLEDLFSFIGQHLAQNGRFYLLLPYKRKAEAEQLLDTSSLFAHKMVHVRQSTRHDYFRLMIEGGRQQPGQPVYSEIAVQDETQEYTPAFTALLKDYYLYL